MYKLYAEDTSDGAIHPIATLRSVRFSRAMREAEKMEKSRGGKVRYFIAKPSEDGTPDKATAAYLGVRRKPAPVGSPAHQDHMRRTAQRHVSKVVARRVDWESRTVEDQENA